MKHCNKRIFMHRISAIFKFIQKDYFSVVHDQNLVASEDCVETMSNDQHCTISKRFTYRVLHQTIGFAVDGSCGFIEHYDAGVTKNGSSHAKQLSFANTEVFTIFNDFAVKFVWKFADLVKHALSVRFGGNAFNAVFWHSVLIPHILYVVV